MQSTLGIGTTFEILLPAANTKVMKPTPAVALSDADKNQGKTILVMDDEEMIRLIAVEVLGDLGYLPKMCNDGEEAVKMYAEALQAEKPFDAVIMDLTIPGGMGGREAAERIRALDTTACLIVSSGFSNDTVMSEFEKHGFRAALPKPYRAAELVQLLNSLFCSES